MPYSPSAVGVLNDAGILNLAHTGKIILPNPAVGQVQPASLDLRLGAKAYRVRASFLPGSSKVEDVLPDVTHYQVDLTNGAVLETDAIYLVPLEEGFALPAEIWGKTNPKSSTGRLDVFVRVIADYSSSFDTVPAGYHGKLWLEIVPKTFPIFVRRGSRLAQVRLSLGDPRISGEWLERVHAKEQLVSSNGKLMHNGVSCGVDLRPSSDGIVGWRARRHAGVVDVDKVAAHDKCDYWDPISPAKNGKIILEPDQFYILASEEMIRVPTNLAAEMVPFDAGIGEFRAHYAGFFDPGFGMTPSKAVLEVRARDVPFLLEHGQTVAFLHYETMFDPPLAAYGNGLNSNYQGQSLKLSKHFY